MTEPCLDGPRLSFFRKTPGNLKSDSPLASSLQTLETSFILVAMNRLPHALVTCCSAVESVLKAAIGAKEREEWRFMTLINEARMKGFRSRLSDADIKEFCLKRNDFVHCGFSPKDDSVSARLLLHLGYPLIQQCYEWGFKFSLLGRDGGLLPSLAFHLDVARRVYLRVRELPGIDPAHCFISFAHWIRWYVSPSFMVDWQMDLEDACGGNPAWGQQFKEKGELQRKFEPALVFDCPVCGGVDSFIAELNKDKLPKRVVSLNRAACVHCGLYIPRGCSFLADELCDGQIGRSSAELFKDYGIKPSA